MVKKEGVLMETKKVNFKNGDEIITISSIEDFIDIELAVLEDSFYSTPCGKYFRNKVNELEKRPIYWLFNSGKKNGFKCIFRVEN